MTDDLNEWLPQLRRVMPVVQEVQNDDGSRTVVASVEVWNHGLIVQAMVVSLNPEWLLGWPKPRMWACADDVGNDYKFVSGGAVGDGLRYMIERVEFIPLPPPEANRLVLSPPGAPGATIVVEL